jgi:hypothetical protein
VLPIPVPLSVGQEGLDIHHYCHAITHWNLPANPVDLEQREGRIHSYKAHAVLIAQTDTGCTSESDVFKGNSHISCRYVPFDG